MSPTNTNARFKADGSINWASGVGRAEGRRRLIEAEDEVNRLREALTTVQCLVNIPPEQILDDAERVRRIKFVVDTALHHGWEQQA